MPIPITDAPLRQTMLRRRSHQRSPVSLHYCAYGSETPKLPETVKTDEAKADLSPAAAPQKSVTTEFDAPSLVGKRVVVCEDEGITLLQLRKVLTRTGLQVVGIATNGKDGVEIALRERPEIVLMDIKMPVMNGLDAAAAILAAYTPCVVMLSAFSEAEYREKAQQIGVAGYINKPITSNTLAYQLEAAYSRYREAK